MGAMTPHLGMHLGQNLLITVVIAHQQAKFVVLMQSWQHQLMLGSFILRNIIQFLRYHTQRIYHQLVHTPSDSYR